MKKVVEVEIDSRRSAVFQEHDFSNDPFSEENLRKEAIISGKVIIPEIPVRKVQSFEA